MRVADDALGSGVGLALLHHLMAVARGRGYETLLLETGTGAPFAAANALYLRNGFTRRGPFADYVASEFNIFYECRLWGFTAKVASSGQRLSSPDHSPAATRSVRRYATRGARDRAATNP